MLIKRFFLFFLIISPFTFFGQENFNSKDQVLQVYNSLVKFHINPLQCDDSLSTIVFNTMLKLLDPNYYYFTNEDILKLEKYKTTIDDELKTSEWKYLDELSSLYKSKLIKTDSIISWILENPIDYNATDSIIWSNKNNYFNKDESERFITWKKYLKFQGLEKGWERSNNDSLKNYLSDEINESSIRNDIRTKEKRRINRIINHPWGYDTFLSYLFCKSLAAAFDPHTEFLPPIEKEKFDSEISSDAWIFGLDIDENIKGEIVITYLSTGEPAWRCGLLNIDDVILELKWDNHDAIDLTASTKEEVYSILDELNHESLRFKIKKTNGQIIFISLKKEKLNINGRRVKSFVLNGLEKIGYILLPAFYTKDDFGSGKSCAKDVSDEIWKLKSDSIKGLIFDLRNNGGGSITEALEIINFFVTNGKLTFKGHPSKRSISINDPNKGVIYTGPLLLMVDRQSASASELLAGVLQDYNRAIIVGNRTFGKSTEQIVIPVDSNLFPQSKISNYNRAITKFGYLKITVGKMYRATGKTIQGKGAIPDIILPEFPDYYKFHESDLPRYIEPDSINNNSYFKPFKVLPIDVLSIKSFERVKNNNYFNSIRQANFWITNQSMSTIVIPLQYKKFITEKKKSNEYVEKFYGFVKSKKEIDFILNNNTTYLNISHKSKDIYNDNSKYIHFISSEIYVNESYRIICDYINLLKK